MQLVFNRALCIWMKAELPEGTGSESNISTAAVSPDNASVAEQPISVGTIKSYEQDNAMQKAADEINSTNSKQDTTKVDGKLTVAEETQKGHVN